jgi:hypothetical protein
MYQKHDNEHPVETPRRIGEILPAVLAQYLDLAIEDISESLSNETQENSELIALG